MSNCTLCLAKLGKSRKHFVANAELQEIFERITNTELYREYGSNKLCYICLAVLQRCQSFYKMSWNAEKTFDYLISNNIEVSPQQITKLNLALQSLGVTSTNHLSIIDSKPEVKEVVNEMTEIKVEPEVKEVDEMREIKDMPEPADTVCRACLVGQTQMHCVQTNALKDVFENLTELKLNTTGRPTEVCYICLSHLKKFSKIIKLSTAEIISRNEIPMIFTKTGTNLSNPEMAHNLTSASFSTFITRNTEPVKIKEETKIVETKEVYECLICNKRLKSILYLERHLKTHTCRYCDEKFRTKSSLIRHEKLHSSYICDYCQKEFHKKEMLQRHIRLHTGLKPHACKVCDKSFAYIGNYNQHVKTHTKFKPFSCQRCSETFYDRITLNRHMNDHGKEFTCDYCHKTYPRKGQLERHLKIHTNDKPFACNICDKAYYDKPNLVRHSRSHTGERPFKCYKCHKTFIDESALQRHLRTHGEKTFTCNVCNLKVSTSFVLQSHMRKHTGIKPYRCITCYKSYFSNKDLQRHVQSHSNKLFACTKCDKSFKIQASLRKHIFKHEVKDPNACEICNKMFTRRRYLKAHMRVHSSERPYACDECAHTFKHQRNFRRHKNLHASKNKINNVCKICSASFRLSVALRIHEKTHIHNNEQDISS